MSWHPLLALPARVLAPLLLGVLALVAAALNHQWQVRTQVAAVAQTELQWLHDRLGVEQTRLETQLAQSNPLQVRRLVSSLALRQGVSHAWLLDAEQRVQASLSRADLGQLLSQVLAKHPDDLPQAQHPTLRQAVSVWTPGLQVLPLADAHTALGVAGVHPEHVLVVRLDYSQAVARQLVQEQGNMVRAGAMVLVFMAMLAWLLHALWFRRAQQLTATTQALGRGLLGARAHLSGRDELAAIGAAVDQMASDLQLRQTEVNRLAELIGHSPVVTFSWRNTPGWPVDYVSPNVSQWGYSRTDFLTGKLQFASLIHPDDLPRIEADVATHLAQGPDEYQQEYRLRHAMGHHLWLDDRTWLTRNAQGEVTAIHGVLLDISARKQAQLDLALQMERLGNAEHHAQLGSWTFDPATKTVWWSDQLYQLLGIARTAQPPTLQAYLRHVHPDDRAMVETGWHRMAQRLDPEHAPFRSNPELAPLRWFKPSVNAERDAQGQVLRFHGTLLDITELKLADLELRALNASLESRVNARTAELSELNQSLESFVYSVSHDLKAPLRGVEGYSRLLQADYAQQLEGDGRLFITHIREGVARMDQLISDLLAYSRMERRALACTAVDLNALVNDVLTERAHDIERGQVQVEVDLPPMRVLADADGLAIALRNLLENALKFSRSAHPPRIQIRGNTDDNTAVFWVQDNGIGFDMKYHDRIFEIFQRLHRMEDHPGTGIGLALVRKAMQRMGGKVWALSHPNEGARFTLSLPLAPARPAGRHPLADRHTTHTPGSTSA
jgi:PAS domain S-box-containing protein